MLKNLFMLCLLVLTMSSTMAADANKGKALYNSKCVQCHGENALGNVEKKAPKLAGQYDWYIETQLGNFKKKIRNNVDMDPIIADLTDADFKDISLYISQIKK